jgi:hypothetical protein
MKLCLLFSAYVFYFCNDDLNVTRCSSDQCMDQYIGTSHSAIDLRLLGSMTDYNALIPCESFNIK